MPWCLLAFSKLKLRGVRAAPEKTRMTENHSSRASPEVVSHFWAASYPFFETTLFVTPSLASLPTAPTRIRLYDADGEVVNDLSVEVEPGRVGVFELEQFLGGCKLEGGLKHAHIEVNSPAGTRHLCRMHARSGVSLHAEATELSHLRSVFFPLSFARGVDSVVCFVNYSTEPATAKLRLFVGSRNPEMFVEIPGRGARVVSVAADFGEFVGGGEADLGPGYVRLSTKGDARLGVHLIQRLAARDERSEGDAFAAVG